MNEQWYMNDFEITNNQDCFYRKTFFNGRAFL